MHYEPRFSDPLFKTQNPSHPQYMPAVFKAETGRLRVAPRIQKRIRLRCAQRSRNVGIGDALPAWRSFVQHQRTRTSGCDGDKLSKRLQNALGRIDQFDDGQYDRSDDQRELHRVIHSACLPDMYQDTLEQNKARLFREFQIDEINKAVMANWPRRFGKSFALAQIAAAYVYTQPDTEVLIYSTSKETSQAMLAAVRIMLRAASLTGDESCIRGKGSKQRVEVITPEGDKNLCICYACSEQVSFDICRFFLHETDPDREIECSVPSDLYFSADSRGVWK